MQLTFDFNFQRERERFHSEIEALIRRLDSHSKQLERISQPQTGARTLKEHATRKRRPRP